MGFHIYPCIHKEKLSWKKAITKKSCHGENLLWPKVIWKTFHAVFFFRMIFFPDHPFFLCNLFLQYIVFFLYFAFFLHFAFFPQWSWSSVSSAGKIRNIWRRSVFVPAVPFGASFCGGCSSVQSSHTRRSGCREGK